MGKMVPRPEAGSPHAIRNRGALPADLLGVDQVVGVQTKACACRGGARHLIGDAKVTMLDFVPPRLRVAVIRRPRYGYRSCGEVVVQVSATERLIDGSMGDQGTAGTRAGQKI